MSFEPRTGLEKILCGAAYTARTRLEKAVKTAMDSIASAVELPTVSNTDNGKILGVSSGKWQKVSPVDYSPFAVTATASQSGEATVLTLNKKASALYDAVASGRMVKITLEDVTMIVAMVANKDTDGSTTYRFRFIDLDGDAFSTTAIAGTADVVLTEESST